MWFLIVEVAIFVSVLVNAGERCRSVEYEVNGICCPTCDKGSVVRQNCTHDSSTSCRPCERGTYMDMASGLSQCYSCRTCKAEQGLLAERECTREQDSACSVLDGFYCQKPNQESGCTLAQKHTRCNIGQMTKLPGTRATDTVCEDCKTGYFSTTGITCTEWKSCGNGKELQKGSQTKDAVCGTAPRGHHYVVILSVLLLLLQG